MQCSHATVNRVKNTFPKETDVMNPGNRFESSAHSVFRFSDPANVGKSLHDGNEDHLLHQARSENCGAGCINELQQQAYAQRLELEDAHHVYIQSRREQSRLQEEFIIYE